MNDPRLDLDEETMRRLGHRVVDLLAKRLATLDDAPAWGGAPRAHLAARLHRPAPEDPMPFDAILDELRTDVVPYAARVDHPRFMAFVPGSPTWPGILADLIASGHNLFQGTWLGAAGPSQVEIEVLDWFRSWLGMPAGAGGLFTSGGSAATLIAVAAARRLRFGAHDARAVVYIGSECHSSVERALTFLGFAADAIRVVPTDEHQRMPLHRLAEMVEGDLRAGRTPFLVVANGGATSTGAIDPLPGLSALCRTHGLWLHVDAAYGGFAVLTGRGRAALEGIAEADSVTLDPHKWLYQPFEAGCLMVRDTAALESAFRIVPDYLKDAEIPTANGGGPPREVNFTDRGFQLTRSARALKVWVSIHAFGLAAFRATIDRTLDLALHAELRIRTSAELELVTPATLGIVCFRRRVDGAQAHVEAVNTELVRALAASGVGMVSSTRVNGRYALRVCIMNHRTRTADVDRVLDWLEAAPIGNGVAQPDRETSR